MTRRLVLAAALLLAMPAALYAEHRHAPRCRSVSACRKAIAWERSVRRHQARLLAAAFRAKAIIVWTPVHRVELLCIHRGEGPWNDPDAPYYGGVQMDSVFAWAYAPRASRLLGTPDHWPPVLQMDAAEMAIPSRGYAPWPNTARACGLLP